MDKLLYAILIGLAIGIIKLLADSKKKDDNSCDDYDDLTGAGGAA